VTRLRDFGAGEGYTLLLDFGWFHTLPIDRRNPYVQSVSEVAATGAMLLLFGFKRPPRLAPMQAGLTAEEVRERFADNRWELVSAEPVRTDEIRAVGRRVDETGATDCGGDERPGLPPAPLPRHGARRCPRRR
jgi:hypothetical protein